MIVLFITYILHFLFAVIKRSKKEPIERTLNDIFDFDDVGTVTTCSEIQVFLSL